MPRLNIAARRGACGDDRCDLAVGDRLPSRPRPPCAGAERYMRRSRATSDSRRSGARGRGGARIRVCAPLLWTRFGPRRHRRGFPRPRRGLGGVRRVGIHVLVLPSGRRGGWASVLVVARRPRGRRCRRGLRHLRWRDLASRRRRLGGSTRRWRGMRALERARLGRGQRGTPSGHAVVLRCVARPGRGARRGARSRACAAADTRSPAPRDGSWSLSYRRCSRPTVRRRPAGGGPVRRARRLRPRVHARRGRVRGSRLRSALAWLAPASRCTESRHSCASPCEIVPSRRPDGRGGLPGARIRAAARAVHAAVTRADRRRAARSAVQELRSARGDDRGGAGAGRRRHGARRLPRLAARQRPLARPRGAVESYGRRVRSAPRPPRSPCRRSGTACSG